MLHLSCKFLMRNLTAEIVSIRRFHLNNEVYHYILLRRVRPSWNFTFSFYFNRFQPSMCLYTSCIAHKKLTDEEKLRKVENFNFVSSKKRKKVIEVWPNMTVQELSKQMAKSIDDVFELMTFVNKTAHLNNPTDVISDWDTICELVSKANLRYKFASKSSTSNVIMEKEDIGRYPPAPEEDLKKRPPVVTIMGHVDHGKTTLLDYLRKSSIVSEEFGGITQHIGAFSVPVQSSSITFLDTPGHAAFTSMRARGANCTDIIVLVVAADDGVMEQTIESIRMAKEANVPIVIAINKIDKPNADLERTKKMLLMQGLELEEFGGDIQVVPISALKGTNVNELTEAILVQAELSNLRADYKGFVEGVVIESRQDRYKGKLCTALIQRGILKRGCILTAELAWAKVRAMYDDQNRKITKATPSLPVEIIGWQDLPLPGDLLIEVETEKKASEVISFRKKKALTQKGLNDLPVVEERRIKERSIYRERLLDKRKHKYAGVKWKAPDTKQNESKTDHSLPAFNIVIKGDVEGSVEALMDILKTYHCHSQCKLDIIHFGVGNVSQADIEIADAFKAVVYNFNVDVLPEAKNLAEIKKIAIQPHNVIYKFLDDVRKQINSRLPPLKMEEVTGEAIVQELFLITENKKKNIPVAGCKCVKGELKKSSEYKVIRNGEEIHRGPLSSMRNLKIEVISIKKDQLCGLKFENTSVVFKPGDTIQAFRTYEVPQEINWNPF